MAVKTIRTISIAIVAGLIAGAGHAQGGASTDYLPSLPAGQHWNKVFDDEFDRLDPSTWSVRGDGPRFGGLWLKANVEAFAGHHLTINTGRSGTMMTAGGLDTKGKREWKYGYFVMRAKLPERPAGHRPAFWLQTDGTFQMGNEGRDGTEVDIFEAWARDGHIQHNLHWDAERSGPQHGNATQTAPVTVSYNQWHTFSMWWSPDKYRFYIDGKLTWETSAGGVSQVPEYMLITDEVLGHDKMALVNAMAMTGRDPFVIDYVRVYQTVPPPPGS